MPVAMVVAVSDEAWKSAAAALKARGFRVVRARSPEAARILLGAFLFDVKVDEGDLRDGEAIHLRPVTGSGG
ncbi:MAG TPA: hypothetical protein VH560_15620 [Polyangia bacterium]|jgi:hypothetical protein|nr:hypothetical protein [Polyangia bacterium]